MNSVPNMLPMVAPLLTSGMVEYVKAHNAPSGIFYSLW